MLKHHEESIEKMIAHYRETPEIEALFLIGSVATGTERPDSDLDGVAVVPEEYYEQKKKIGKTMDSYWGKCTYEGGYFDVHFKTNQELVNLAENGSEPMRNMFSCARTLFSDDPELPELVKRIPVFQKSEKAAKQLRYYCTLRQSFNYFWMVCKPEGFARVHTASGMIFCLYRLILLENEILFPSVRKLERTVKIAPNKPENIIEKCQHFIQTMADEDALALVESYENWTSYDYPKDFQFVANNFNDPYENQ